MRLHVVCFEARFLMESPLQSVLPPRPEHCLQVNLCYLRVGGLIGIVTPGKNGLKPASEATVVFQKANNTKACILVNTNHAGETFTALLGISGVSGYTATIIITVNKWNSTMLFAKTLVGTIPDGAKLSYKIDTSGNVNIYINSTAYLLITLKPISTINASIDTVSAIPDGTISISL